MNRIIDILLQIVFFSGEKLRSIQHNIWDMCKQFVIKMFWTRTLCSWQQWKWKVCRFGSSMYAFNNEKNGWEKERRWLNYLIVREHELVASISFSIKILINKCDVMAAHSVIWSVGIVCIESLMFAVSLTVFSRQLFQAPRLLERVNIVTCLIKHNFKY